MQDNQIVIDIITRTNDWHSISNIQSKIQKIVRSIIVKIPVSEFLKSNNQIELAICLANSKQIKAINNQHRQKNKSTNILSFPALDLESDKPNFKSLAKSRQFLFLGDIIISLDNIRKEVNQSYSKTFDSHLTHLILHSILHLIGHDHRNDQDADKMELLEVKILKSLKIKDPYSDDC